MKTLRFFLLFTLLLQTVARPQGVVEEPLRTDAQGNLLRPLNLGGPNVRGLGGAALLNLGTAAGTVAAGDDPRILKTFTPEQFPASGTDDTAIVQAAVTAACANAPAKVLLSRTYTVSATLTGNAAISVEGINENSGIITTAATGDIFSFAPSGTVNPQVVSTGLQRLTFKNFFIDAAAPMTSGAAIHPVWTDSTIIDNVRIGTANLNANGAAPNIFDAVYLDKQSNCWINHPQFYASDQGLIVTGGSTAATAWFAFGGWIGGGGFCYGTYATPSIGVHVAGMCGGFELGDFDCGQWGKYALLCDTALAAGTNHELFIGRSFQDSAGVCGIFIGSNSLNILKVTGGWGSGCGRLPGLAFGGSNPVYNGAGLYVQGPQAILQIDVTGGTFYSNYGDGILIEDCESGIINGVHAYNNGVGGAGGNGLHITGGGNIIVGDNVLIYNGGWGVNVAAAASAYLIRDNDVAGNVLGPILDGNAGSNSYLYDVDENLGAGDPKFHTHIYNPNSAYPGFAFGYNTTPRALWSTGIPGNEWEIDNSGGTMRWFQGATLAMALSQTSLAYEGNFLLGTAGLPALGTSYSVTFGGTPAGVYNTYPSAQSGQPNVGLVLKTYNLGAVVNALSLAPGGAMITPTIQTSASLVGAGINGGTTGSGLDFGIAFNVTGNKQFLVYDPDYATSTTGAGFRVLVESGAVSFDAVNGANTAAEPISTDSPFTFGVLAALTPRTYANRAASPGVGTVQMFSDSTTQTWGATISGGGSLPALGLWDGANWTVIGK